MTILAVVLTLVAWIGGLIIDSNLSHTTFSTILPIVTMGTFILEAIKRRKS
jgi:hypothetical protein